MTTQYFSDVHSLWAKVVSDVVSPPVIWGIMAFPIAARNAPSPEAALLWATIYVLLVSIAPIVYILIQVRRGNITDMHMPLREERIRPFIVSTITAVAAAFLFYAINASMIMRLFTISSLIQLVIMALITTIWQISIHTVSVSGMVVTAGALFGTSTALILAPVILLVAVARLRLRRHTRAQVIAGIIVGTISVSILLGIAGLLEPGIWAQH
jgi:hypothetical protein